MPGIPSQYLHLNLHLSIGLGVGGPSKVTSSMLPTCGHCPDLGLQPDLSPELQPEAPAAFWTTVPVCGPQAPKASTSQPDSSGSYSSGLAPHPPSGHPPHFALSFPSVSQLFYLGDGGRREGKRKGMKDRGRKRKRKERNDGGRKLVSWVCFYHRRLWMSQECHPLRSLGLWSKWPRGVGAAPGSWTPGLPVPRPPPSNAADP